MFVCVYIYVCVYRYIYIYIRNKYHKYVFRPKINKTT